MPEDNQTTNIKTVLQIDNELIENVTGLIKSGAEKSVLNLFADLHSADIAEIINHIDVESAKKRIFCVGYGNCCVIIT